jgi:hypothetical protein
MGLLCCFSNAKSRTAGVHPEPNVAAVPLTSQPSPPTTQKLTDTSVAPGVPPFSDPITSDSQPGPENRLGETPQPNDSSPPSDQIIETADEGMSEIVYNTDELYRNKGFSN